MLSRKDTEIDAQVEALEKQAVEEEDRINAESINELIAKLKTLVKEYNDKDDVVNDSMVKLDQRPGNDLTEAEDNHPATRPALPGRTMITKYWALRQISCVKK